MLARTVNLYIHRLGWEPWERKFNESETFFVKYQVPTNWYTLDNILYLRVTIYQIYCTDKKWESQLYCCLWISWLLCNYVISQPVLCWARNDLILPRSSLFTSSGTNERPFGVASATRSSTVTFSKPFFFTISLQCNFSSSRHPHSISL